MTFMRVSGLFILFIMSVSALEAGNYEATGLKKSSERLDRVAARLPVKLQKTIGSRLLKISHELKKRVKKIKIHLPSVNRDITMHLEHTSDLANSLVEHVDSLLKKRLTLVDRMLAARINQLERLIMKSLDRVDLMVSGWIEKTKDAVIDVVDEADARVVKLVDKIFFDGVRYTGIVLFLVGLLAISLKLLTFIEQGVSWDTIGKTRVLAGVTLLSLLLYFSITMLAVVNPGALAFLSTTMKSIPDTEHCVVHNTQKMLLKEVETLQHQPLNQRIQKRLDKSRAKCPGAHGG